MTIPPGVKRWGPVLGSSVLFQLCLPPFNMSLLCFVALAPWLAWLRTADAKEARQSGAVFGAIYGLTQMWFVVVLMQNYMGAWWLGAILLVVMAAILAGFYWCLGALLKECWRSGWWFAIPLVWAGFEAARAFAGPVAFPWGSLAHSLWSLPALIQHASVGTIFLVSAWCVLPSLLIGFWIWPPAKPEDKVGGSVQYRVAAIFLIFLMGSAWRAGSPPETQRRVVTLGQPGIDLAYTPLAERTLLAREAAIQLEARVLAQGGADLLILPEGFAKGGSLPPDNPFGPSPAVSVLFGGTYLAEGKNHQGAFAYDAAAGQWGATGKERLVIMGEYLPFANVVPYRDWLGLRFLSFDAYSRHKLLEAGPLKVGTLICYEGLFSDTTATLQGDGANMLAIISIDDWYVGTPAWDQLWQQAVWRAVESGLPVARVGGLGKTVAVDARGGVLADVDPGGLAAARVELPVPDRGDGFPYRMVFVWLCWAACAGIGWSLLQAHRSGMVKPAE